jgi:hypothetical protein
MRCLQVVWAIGTISLSACNDSSQQQSDLSSGDMSLPPDFALGDADMSQGSICSGTPLAGSCVDRFFTLVSTNCFPHMGGCLAADHPAQQTRTYCWADGSYLIQFEQTVDGGQNRRLDTWSTTSPPNLKQCFSGSTTTASLGTPGDETFGGDAMQLTYDPIAGTATCPDGSHVTVGPAAQCPQLAAIIEPTCPVGTCP